MLHDTALLKKVLDDAAQMLGNLRGRWADESQYEDIKDYAVLLQRILDRHNCQITKMTTKPFGFQFEHQKLKYYMTCSLRGDVKAGYIQ